MNNTLLKDIVLIGGGHTHALVLRMWSMKPMAGVRLTLISPQTHSPYSGMLPGLIAGHYTFDQTHIDLARLCQAAGACFIQAAATGVDTHKQQVRLPGRPALGYDLLSINTGIQPRREDLPEAAPNSLGVKPISELYPRWLYLRQQLLAQKEPANIVVVGAGAAGFELVLAMRHALADTPHRFHLAYTGNDILNGYPRALRHRAHAALQAAGVHLHPGFTASHSEGGHLFSREGRQLPADFNLWCTEATAPRWPRNSGLATDESGFIQINSNLQLPGHNTIFACGDIAAFNEQPLPKAGVYAVRQAKTLFHNLRASLLQKKLRPFKPQKAYLSLLTLGGKRALGCRVNSYDKALEGRWVWHWKDAVDRRFMARFAPPQLKPAMPVASTPSRLLQQQPDISRFAMRCGGCGAKVGTSILSRVIADLAPVAGENVVMGLASRDDAAAFRVPPGKLVIQSIDHFRALVGDPYLQGRIAANHALGDLFAMNAEAHSALALTTLPFAAEAITERDLGQLMAGALAQLNAEGCSLLGGHSGEGAELSIGFSVNGLAGEAELLRKRGLQAGQHLILTKALGTGSLFAAHHQLAADGRWIAAAIDSMCQSNREAARVLFAHGAGACTDVTGFGLLGHLLEMLEASAASAVLDLERLPLLEGAQASSERGIVSSLQPHNLRRQSAIGNGTVWERHPRWPLLFDPQTAGGLLAGIAEDKVESCLAQLREAGYTRACVIGKVMPREESWVLLDSEI